MNLELQKQLEAVQDLEILGFFCWWSIRNANVTHEQLEEWFKANDLSPDLLISAPTYESAFNKACNKINRQKFNDDIYLVRPVLKDQNRVIVAVVRENEVSENLEHRQEFKLILDRNTGALISENPGNSLSEQIVQSYFSYKGTHDSLDICKQILNVINSGSALHVRSGGGIYFLLFENKALVDKLELFVKEHNFGDFYALPQLNIAKVRNAISQAFTGNIYNDIASFNKTIEDWNNKKPQNKSLDKAILEIDLVKEKIKTYSRVLKLDVSSFDSPISSIENGIKALSQRKIKVQ